MKRSPLARRTPLRSTSTLRRTPMPDRATPLRSAKRLGLLRPGRPVVSPEERRARELVSMRSGGFCELRVPEVCMGRATDWAHRRPRSQGGPWSADNGLHACRLCHAWCHANPASARTRGWVLRSHDPIDTSAALLNGRSWSLLRPDGTVEVIRTVKEN